MIAASTGNYRPLTQEYKRTVSIIVFLLFCDYDFFGTLGGHHGDLIEHVGDLIEHVGDFGVQLGASTLHGPQEA
jgi:hypothetical protein